MLNAVAFKRDRHTEVSYRTQSLTHLRDELHFISDVGHFDGIFKQKIIAHSLFWWWWWCTNVTLNSHKGVRFRCGYFQDQSCDPRILFRVVVWLEPIAAATGREAGYALDRSPVCCRANTWRQKPICTHITSIGNFKLLVNLTPLPSSL